MIFGSMATALNFYLVSSLISSTELRDAVNYPVFLLTVIDFLTTGPGYILCYLAREFILYHPSNFPENYISHGIQLYEKIRRQIQLLIQQLIVQNIHPFWFGCLPHLFIIRVNEVGFGLCSILIAYERYNLLCKPTEKSTLLSKRRRQTSYVLITLTIISVSVAESVYHYIYRHYECLFLVRGFANAKVGHLLNLSSILVFSLPASLCCYCYFKVAKVLFSRKKKIGRNLNLIFCFIAICVVWILSIMFKLFPVVYYTFSTLYTKESTKMHEFPLQFIIEHLSMLSLLGGITSLFDPILILVSQRDYRKPFTNFQKNLRRLFKRKNEHATREQISCGISDPINP